ncbi:hypothetical protein C2869_04000 [Saccharobesus litoralis]|uniref:Uncharacterized protein n=1 Tax=Saccharobesus litoralis TaxID=2172099 RepID=A0A2S0VNA1_9ALTE|nr:hypothetical protein [Saccharobesus litoralis]AWB65649.1 hypothetical protein C2869_04000 [Saccharobesus litoralis]
MKNKINSIIPSSLSNPTQPTDFRAVVEIPSNKTFGTFNADNMNRIHFMIITASIREAVSSIETWLYNADPAILNSNLKYIFHIGMNQVSYFERTGTDKKWEDYMFWLCQEYNIVINLSYFVWGTHGESRVNVIKALTQDTDEDNEGTINEWKRTNLADRNKRGKSIPYGLLRNFVLHKALVLVKRKNYQEGRDIFITLDAEPLGLIEPLEDVSTVIKHNQGLKINNEPENNHSRLIKATLSSFSENKTNYTIAKLKWCVNDVVDLAQKIREKRGEQAPWPEPLKDSLALALKESCVYLNKCQAKSYPCEPFFAFTINKDKMTTWEGQLNQHIMTGLTDLSDGWTANCVETTLAGKTIAVTKGVKTYYVTILNKLCGFTTGEGKSLETQLKKDTDYEIKSFINKDYAIPTSFSGVFGDYLLSRCTNNHIQIKGSDLENIRNVAWPEVAEDDVIFDLTI